MGQRVLALTAGALLAVAVSVVGFVFWSCCTAFDRASGDGRDDSEFLQRAISGRGFVRIQSGEYTLKEPLRIPDGVTLYFENVTINTEGGPALLIDGTRDWSIDGRLRIDGRGVTDTAVVINNPIGGYIHDLIVTGAVSGIKISGQSQSLPRANTLRIGSVGLSGNKTGIEIVAGAGGEFVTIQNIEARGNELAAQIAAGNAKILGGNIVDNGNGILFTSGHNHGHGIVSGVTIAHNHGFNLRFDDVVTGFVLTGNTIYGDSLESGLVEINKSRGVLITDSILSAHVVVRDPVGPSYLCSNFIPPDTSSVVGDVAVCSGSVP